MSDRRRVMGGTGSYKIYFNAIWNGGNPCYKVLGAPYWVSAVNEYDSNPSFVINYSTDSDISNKIFITSWAPTYDEMIEQWHVALSKIDTGYSVLYSNDIDQGYFFSYPAYVSLYECEPDRAQNFVALSDGYTHFVPTNAPRVGGELYITFLRYYGGSYYNGIIKQNYPDYGQYIIKYTDDLLKDVS